MGLCRPPVRCGIGYRFLSELSHTVAGDVSAECNPTGGAEMSQKNQDTGVAGAMPAVTDPGRVRNVVLVGHSGAGKTTLVEALLAATGTIGRAGSVTEGTTVSDSDPAAVKQQRSVALACAPVHHEGFKINLLDTPGYADFVGELRAALRAADAA